MPYKALIAICAVCICYGMYLTEGGGGGNGVVFGSVMAIIGALAGLGASRALKEYEKGE